MFVCLVLVGLLLHSLIKSFRSSAAWIEYEMGTFSFGLILICSIPTIKGLTLRKKGKGKIQENERGGQSCPMTGEFSVISHFRDSLAIVGRS